MNPEQKPIGVYIKADQNNSILDIGSELFLPDIAGWLRIDEGVGDRYAHAQGNYLPGPIRDESGIPNYRYVPGGEVPYTERTEAEKQAEMAALPAQQPMEVEALRTQVLQTQEALAALYEALGGGN